MVVTSRGLLVFSLSERMVFRKKGSLVVVFGRLAGDIGGQVLGDGGRLSRVDQEVDLVQGVFAVGALAAVQLVQIGDIVEVC